MKSLAAISGLILGAFCGVATASPFFLVQESHLILPIGCSEKEKPAWKRAFDAPLDGLQRGTKLLFLPPGGVPEEVTLGIGECIKGECRSNYWGLALRSAQNHPVGILVPSSPVSEFSIFSPAGRGCGSTPDLPKGMKEIGPPHCAVWEAKRASRVFRLATFSRTHATADCKDAGTEGSTCTALQSGVRLSIAEGKSVRTTPWQLEENVHKRLEPVAVQERKDGSLVLLATELIGICCPAEGRPVELKINLGGVTPALERASEGLTAGGQPCD